MSLPHVGSPSTRRRIVFGAQRTPTPGVFALAATVQPLIRRPRCRPARWVNMHSPWDPISGPLDYYDPPRGTSDKRRRQAVDRQARDPEATTLFLAHVEYWEGR